LALLVLAVTAAADLAVDEMELNPEGYAYEVNAGPGGLLWISENGAAEIWAVDPASGDYTVYLDAGAVSDARPAPDGTVWWLDQATDRLAHLVPGSRDVTLWDLPVETAPFGTAIDGNGDLWLTEYYRPRVYRFSLSSGQLCTYTLATSGASDYLLADGADIWLGDRINDAIHRLDGDSGQLTSWGLPFNARPEGLALDGQGLVWWADSIRGHLARLEPDQDLLTTYALPLGSTPRMLAISGHRLWYTEDSRRTLGRLDPYLATSTSQTLATEPATLTPSCTFISPAVTGKLRTSTRTATWASASYALAHYTGGWWIHDLPTDGWPWGVAFSGGHVWMVDNGRQVLARVSESLSLVACKQQDADGDPLTTTDRSPLPGWSIHLLAGGQPVEPGRLTGLTGCAVWDDLESGVSYGLADDESVDWTPLTPTSHEFGVLMPGQPYVHTFVNARSAEVTACKESDADGDPGTPNDQDPIEDWTLYLEVDGVRQEPGLLTGPDGCVTWPDLGPGHTYAVEEDLPEGWTALTPTRHEFGTLAPGASVSHTFVNAEITQSAQVTACKIEDGDGDPVTTDDQTPVEGWTLYLELDGVPQDPGQLTGTDGCTTWSDLAPGASYGVEEEERTGWTPLTPTSHDFGPLAPGASASHTFINFEAVTVTACKVEDLAGDGLTADDPLYDQGWPVSLTADGHVVDTQTTGPGGCYTWDGLGPLAEGAYGVREAEVPGWLATEPAEVTFDPPTSGDTFQAGFANFQQASLTACVVADGDGNPGTSDDQEPQAGWTVYLRVDGGNQLPGQQTGVDGCHTWTGLGPGHTYGAAQALPEGWTALGGTEQDLGPVRSGDAKTITFVNTTQEDYRIFLPVVMRDWH
jgi:streptogramin lyase